MNSSPHTAAAPTELAPYVVTVLPDAESLASLHLSLDSRVKLLISLSMEENKELDSTFALSIDSSDAGLLEVYGVYANALSRLASEVVFVQKYKKTRFVLRVNLLQVLYKTDVLAHIVNALCLVLLLARIDMRYTPVAHTCFIDASGRICSETEANASDVELTRAYLCKKLGNDDEIVSFAISGGHIADARIDAVLAHLLAGANIVGRRLLEFAHALATN